MTSSRHLFQRYIGIDYSGAQTPTSSLKGLRVYIADRARPPVEVPTPIPYHGYWTRQGIAEWLVAQLQEGTPTIIGIDHGFSFPIEYFKRYKLATDWPAFLDDFQKHWPTDHPHNYVDFVRVTNPPRIGDSHWKRICETRCKAKSVFHFDVQGSVAKSTHSGLPWLRYIRNHAKGSVHFWPFDGWEIPANQSVIAEIYPALWSKKFPKEDRDPHQHDAFSVAETLRLADRDGTLQAMFEPQLNQRELEIASIEGWILGLPCTSPPTVDCTICEWMTSDRAIATNDLAVAFPDIESGNDGQTLIVPKRHEANFFSLTSAEQSAMVSLARSVQRRLQRKYAPDGYDISVHVGKAAGQKIDHAYLSLIPRL